MVFEIISYYHDGNSGYNQHDGNPHGGIVGVVVLGLQSDLSFLVGENNDTFPVFFRRHTHYNASRVEIHHDNTEEIYFNLYNDTFTKNYAKNLIGTILENMTYK